jgi:hypothetical protein
VDITKKNISRKDLSIGVIVGSAEVGYDIVAIEAKGNPAVETKYRRMLHGKEPFSDHHSEMLSSLKPGQTVQEHFFANQIYDLGKPGKYTIQVKETVYASQADVKSGVKPKCNQTS